MINHAIVMGGSVAGLCAAAGLAEVAKRVTLVERDPDPGGALTRKGTPQCHHAHALLNLGRTSIEQLMPGIGADLRERGGRRIDMGADFRWLLHGRWRPRFHTGLDVLIQSRPLLEATLREHLATRGNVDLRFDCALEAPIHAEGSVTGVRLADGSELVADLVVDATGRGSRTPQWFEQWGIAAAPEQRVDIGLAYVSGEFRIPADRHPVDALLVFPDPPSHKRGGLFFHVEDDRWIGTFFGYHGDHPPTAFDELLAWTEGLRARDITEVLAGSELVGELRKHPYPRQVRRLYERSSIPAGYLVIGDALCSFDPVFGQGMSVAASEGLALRERLARGPASTRELQRIVAHCGDNAWLLVTVEARHWAETRGWKPPGVELLRRYIRRMHDTAAEDQAVYRAFIDVMHLDSPATSMFRPATLARILRGPSQPPG